MSTDDEVLDEAGRRLDRITLVGLSATGYHGVFDHERRDGQTFVADVVVHLDTRRAAAGDDLEHTLDYGDLAQRIVAVLAGEPVALIETVAERIAATVLARPLARAVDVSVHKPQAPLSVPFADVVVTVRRDRAKLPAAEPWTPADPVAHLGELALHTPPLPAPPAVPGLPAPARSDDDRLDEPPAVPVDVVVALGSNLGASQATLRRAVAELSVLPGLEVTAVSPLARTVAVGGPTQPDFLNAVVLARTTLAPRTLLHALQEVEAAAGRERHEHWGPRTLDLDLVVYGTTTAVTDDLELPHPRAHQRAFVLQPWAEVDPDAVLPGLGGGPVAALAATAPDRDGVRWLALDWLTAPAGAPPADEDAVPHDVAGSGEAPVPEEAVAEEAALPGEAPLPDAAPVPVPDAAPVPVPDGAPVLDEASVPDAVSAPDAVPVPDEAFVRDETSPDEAPADRAPAPGEIAAGGAPTGPAPVVATPTAEPAPADRLAPAGGVMARTRWQTLLLLAVFVMAVTWAALRALVGQGEGLPEVSWLVVLVEVLIAAVVLAMGWQVRQFLAGRRPDLSPLRAARTAVLAKASCYTGALLLGWYGGQVIAHLTDPGVPGAGGRAASAGLAALGALALAVAGLVVEHLCQVPPPPGDETETAPGADPAAG